MVDPRRDDLNACGVRPVKVDELTSLLGAVGQHQVRATHHRRLGLDAALRFEVPSLGLHPSQRVEDGQQGQVQFVLEPVASNATQPVVGQHAVVTGIGL